MEWFEALILGVLQGLTEYLPVSSSGHLAIGSALFGIQGEDNLTFTIAEVHIGLDGQQLPRLVAGLAQLGRVKIFSHFSLQALA